jgi:hypothetical protein
MCNLQKWTKNLLISPTNDVMFSNVFLFEHCMYVHLSLPSGADEQTQYQGFNEFIQDST